MGRTRNAVGQQCPRGFDSLSLRMKKYKLVVFVPVVDAEKVREAIHGAGEGKLGNYSHCSFSSCGTGRFKPEEGAHPTIGKVGKIEEVEEERIEVLCAEEAIRDVVDAMKKAHPYEEPAYDVYALEDFA